MIPAPLASALDAARAGKREPLFLLHGDEDFLVEEAGREAAARLCDAAGGRELKVIRGGKGEAAAIVAEMAALSFFASEIVVLVRNSDLFGEAGEREAEGFLAWFEKTRALPHPLLFTVYDRKGDRGKVDRRRRLYKAVAARGATHDFPEMKSDDAAAWVLARFRSLGKEADRAVADALVDRTGVSLGVLAGEIEKLVLHAGDSKRVTAEAVEALVGPSREEVVWGLTDSVLARKPARALRDLARLIDRSGENPIGILLWLAREFHAVLEARALLDHPRLAGVRMPSEAAGIQSQFVRRLSPEERAGWAGEGFAFLGMHPWAASLRIAAAQKFSGARLREAVVTIADAERLMKTGGGGGERTVLEGTILALAGGGTAA